MANPDRCITCGHDIPEGNNHPHYFAQNVTRDISPRDITDEVRGMCESLAALCGAIAELDDKDPMDDGTKTMLKELSGLAWDLGREIAERAEAAHSRWFDIDRHDTPA